jgi:hypothetical protein
VEQICYNLAAYLIPKIVEIWNEELINLNAITLTAIGLDSYEKMGEVKRFLKGNIRNLKRIYDRGFVQNTAKFELLIRGGSSRKLAEDLSVKKGSNYRFKVKNVDANSLTVAVLPLKTDEPVILTIKGLDSFDKVAEIKQFLRSNIADLKGINDRGYVQNTAKMELMISGGSAQKLAEALTMKEGPDYRLRVTNVETQNLTVMLLPMKVEAPSAQAGQRRIESATTAREDSRTPEAEKPRVEEGKKEPSATAEAKTGVSEPEKFETPEIKKSKDFARVIVNWLNVREFPGPKYKRIGVLKKGEKFPIISTLHSKPDTTWYEIDFKGKRGFIWHGGVEVIKGE